MNKITQAQALIVPGGHLSKFLGNSQAYALSHLLLGEEGGWYADTLIALSERIIAMPKTYEQDGKGDEAMAYLHYFIGGSDFWITEKDMDGDTPQAFGLVRLLDDPELGYISIDELTEKNVELDLHFEPKTIGELKSAYAF